jgi:hypothetical protein
MKKIVEEISGEGLEKLLGERSGSGSGSWLRSL